MPVSGAGIAVERLADGSVGFMPCAGVNIGRLVLLAVNQLVPTTVRTFPNPAELKLTLSK